MLSLPFPASPALVQCLWDGKPNDRGVAATFVQLGSRGLVRVSEGEAGQFRYGVSSGQDADSFSPPERYLWNCMKDPNPVHFAWSSWDNALKEEYRGMGRTGGREWKKALIPRRFLIPKGVWHRRPALRHWRLVREWLRRNPSVGDAQLPRDRREWDERLAYAVAFSCEGEFLSRARAVCENLNAHFQGIVATFYTPRWFVPRHEAGEERFSFLTGVLAPWLSRFRWTHCVREES